MLRVLCIQFNPFHWNMVPVTIYFITISMNRHTQYAGTSLVVEYINAISDRSLVRSNYVASTEAEANLRINRFFADSDNTIFATYQVLEFNPVVLKACFIISIYISNF